MDQFYTLYHEFFDMGQFFYTPAQRARFSMHPPLERFTIEIIGCWDTVAFDRLGRGRINLHDTFFPQNVKYGFHALSLDEKRRPYQPVLWNQHGATDPQQELLQVWFSGDHSDIGGGKEDTRLSDIALVWMIDQCSKHGQLSFNIDGYLRVDPPNDANAVAGWATRNGPIRNSSFTRIFLPSSNRTPLFYHPGRGPTHETLHQSILDRYVPGSHHVGAVFWPCTAVRPGMNGNWVTKNPERAMEFAVLGELEVELAGQVRPYRVPVRR